MNVSIIIPVFNQLHYTKTCLASLWPTIPSDTEIIIIDNASSDGTAEYLSRFPRIKVITNSENLGCAAAWNQGAKASNALWIVIMNNDVVLSSKWLEGLISFAMERHVDIASPAFREGELNYDIARHASDFTRLMYRVSRIGTAQGICFMVHRYVFDKIGFFDEKFVIGQFEDADFFRRAGNAGFTLATTGRSFIHHFGSATQNSVRQKKVVVNYEEKNRIYYRTKHGLKFWRRFVEKRSSELQTWFWSMSEKALYGHTLVEKWIDGRLRYF